MLDVAGLSLDIDDVERLQHPAVGGVILFSRNFASRTQVAELIAQIHSIRTPQLLIAVDQEGGRVQRFKEGFTALPAMAKFGELLDKFESTQSETVLKIVRSTGQLMAEELIDCGVDFSFAPVLDVGVHSDTVIGDRALHADPKQIVLLANAYISGMEVAGMRATGKHFPGHGHVTEDSHSSLPADLRRFAEIEKCDLHVFSELVTKLGAVMTAHVNYPNIDAEIPTYSNFWLQEVLRKRLGFEGLIVSDDLTMAGAGKKLKVKERCDNALKTGCDLLLVCNDTKAMDQALGGFDKKVREISLIRLERMRANKHCPKMKTKLSSAIKTQIEALV